MSYWFYFNFILFCLLLWKVASHFSFPLLKIHIIFGAIGFLFFLYNWTRNAVFSTIRQAKDRQIKIKLANLSRKAMPYHRWTGTLALVFILLHGIAVWNTFGFTWQNGKMMFGLLALLNLIAMVATGWLRLVKTVRQNAAASFAVRNIIVFPNRDSSVIIEEQRP